MERLGVGLLGLGTVGSAVARLLDSASDRISRRVGRRLEVVQAAVRDPARVRNVPVPPDRIVGDWSSLVRDDRVDVVVELMGGLHPAREAVLAAFEAGKHVVTANKALLAEHGAEVFQAARKAGRALAFEASVGGGIPIIQAIGAGLAANRIQAVSAIVNGTCNFILTAMTRDGVSYREALREAQRLGYAEPDPTLDVDGTDTAHKLAILARVAFGANVGMHQIPCQGIDSLQVADVRYAGELGYSLKLLALARLTEAGLVLRVAPRLVRQGTPLADVQGPYNAVRVVGEPVGDTLFYGQGAGAEPTASAVVGDLIDVAIGRASLTFKALDLWSAESAPPRLATPDQVRFRNYLRFFIADRPGVLGTIAQILGAHEISIASVIQHDPGDDDHPDAPVSLVLMTHAASEASLIRALAEIDQLAIVHAPSVRLGVEE